MIYEDFNKSQKYLFNEIERIYMDKPLTLREFIQVLVFLLKKWTPNKVDKEQKKLV